MIVTGFLFTLGALGALVGVVLAVQMLGAAWSSIAVPRKQEPVSWWGTYLWLAIAALFPFSYIWLVKG